MNKTLVAVISIAFLILVGWILNDFNIISFFSRGLSSKDSLGMLAKKVKSVQRREKDSLTWNDAEEEEKLFAYDSILTSNNSEAFLKMNSGVDLNVEENSLITILPPENQLDALTLNLKSGSYKVAMKRGKQIRVGKVVVKSTEDASLSFKLGADSQTHVAVVSGAIHLINETKKGEQPAIDTVKAGQTLTIDPIQSEAKVDLPNLVESQPTPAPTPVPTPVVAQKEPPLEKKKVAQEGQLHHSKAIKKVISTQKAKAHADKSQAESVDKRPDPEAMSQDLSDLPQPSR